MTNVIEFPNPERDRLFDLYADLSDSILYNAGPSLTVTIFASALEKMAQHEQDAKCAEALILGHDALMVVAEQLGDVYAREQDEQVV